jgi:SPP1 gp7 family putative phage head morphogenesis protein
MRVIRISIVDNDAFGIQPDNLTFLEQQLTNQQLLPLSPLRSKAFAFNTTAEKIAGFMEWLESQEERGILEIVRRPGIRPGIQAGWSDIYIDSAYQKGIRRARAEMRKLGLPVPSLESVPGGIGAVMNQPVHADRVAVLYARTFEDLKTVAGQMNAQIRRELADGLTTGLARGIAEGKNPNVIARELVRDLNNRVTKIGITRARTIARTEIIRAHHLATIAEYRQADSEMLVEVKAEWSTAGDDRVCSICIDFEANNPYTLDEIEPLIPAHANCRCSALPLVERGSRKR